MTRALASCFVVVAAAVGCSKTTEVGGILITMSSDGTVTVQPDKLELQITSLDGTTTYGDAGTAPGPVTFPQTLIVRSNGDPSAAVTIDVSLWAGRQPLDVRRYHVFDVPTDRVEPLTVVFSGHCARWAGLDDAGNAVSKCQADATCDPDTGGCETANLGLDGGAPADGSAPIDARVEDASVGDGAGRPAPNEAGAGCTAGSIRCLDDDTPQLCVPDAGWTTGPACEDGTTYCFRGQCVPVPPSCLAAYVDCESGEVSGGTFQRSSDPSAPATVSDFRLDAYEVTVARFRQFVTAVVLDPESALPSAGSGTHAHVNGGNGLNAGGDAGGSYETGWDPSWSAGIATTAAVWNTNLSCTGNPTWTANVDANEGDPITCVTWYEAYAFCIWDGGFLPSEAEWNYAAVGGAAQRVYPWGSEDPGMGAAYAVYGCYYSNPSGLCMGGDYVAPVGSAPMGDGFFGQSDLAGSVWEWNLDEYVSPYPAPCADCAALTGGAQRVLRGGAYDRGKDFLLNTSRTSSDPAARLSDVGLRCARTPS